MVSRKSVYQILSYCNHRLTIDTHFSALAKIIFAIVFFLLFVLGMGGLVASAWIHGHFGGIGLSQALFHITNPLNGVAEPIIASACRHLVYAVILPGLSCLWYYFNPWHSFSFVLNLAEKIVHHVFSFLKKYRFLLFGTAAITLFITGTLVFLNHLDVFSALHYINEKTTLFEEFYYAPKPEEVTFPKHKNNLIVIFLESIENTYNRKDWGPDGTSLIPELESLQKNNYSFPHQLQLNGMGWTAAAINNFAYGLPFVNLWFDSCDAGKNGDYDSRRKVKVFSQCTSIFDVFAEHGYRITLLRGASLEFASMGSILQNCKNCTQYGREELKDNAEYVAIPLHRRNPWGLHDEILLKIAKQKIQQAASNPTPFCFLIESVNTHGYDGYLPPDLAQDGARHSFEEVLQTNSKLFYQFVEWIRQQPFGKNTTIVLLGDHLAMGNPLYKKLMQIPMLPSSSSSPKGTSFRTIYNCFINPVYFPDKVDCKKYFSSFDMAPTLLEVMGARWKNHRFGIGTSILSDEANVFSRYTPEQFNREILKHSSLYRKLFLPTRVNR